MENKNENYKQFIDIEKGKELKYWDKNRVTLSSFTPDGRLVRFFRGKPDNFNTILDSQQLREVVDEVSKESKYLKSNGSELQGFDIHNQVGKHLFKIPSRTVLAEIREPFIIEPWNQCLVDKAVEYGSRVDDNKEEYLFGKIDGSKLMEENQHGLVTALKSNLVWVTRSQMVCHPRALVYGEIDEIWFDRSTNKFVLGDTKTSSSVDKIGYWYQLGVYLEVVKELNPNIDFSDEVIIQWTKIKDQKWTIKDGFQDKDLNGNFKNVAKQYEYSKWILDNKEGKKQETIDTALEHVERIDREILSKYRGRGNEIKPTDPLYYSKWNEQQTWLDTTEYTDELVRCNLKETGVLDLIKEEFAFLNKYRFTTVEEFNNLISTDKEAELENSVLQAKYDQLKEYFEKR